MFKDLRDFINHLERTGQLARVSVPVSRVGGANRFETAAKVSAATVPSASEVFLANGMDYPDALAGGRVPSYDVGQSEAKRWSQLWAAGQGLQSIRSVAPVGEVVAELEHEFHTAAARLERIAGHHP